MANWLNNLVSKVKTEAAQSGSNRGGLGSSVVHTNGNPQQRFISRIGAVKKAMPVRRPDVPKPLVKSSIAPVAPKAIEMAPTFTSTPDVGELSGIPVMHKGGKVKKTGLAFLKKDEVVLPAKIKTPRNKKKVNSHSVLAQEEPDKISPLPITAAPIAYFVRHGDTDMNDDDVFRGDYDPPLNQSGQAQARLLKLFFHSVSPSAIYHSSRIRTKQTIDPLAKEKGIKPTLISNLDSLDTGNFAGKPKDKENKKKMKWYRTHPDAKIPGGQSVRDFQDNADKAFSRLLDEGGKEPGKPVIAGVHGSIIKELGRYLHGDINSAHVEPGGVVGVYKLPSGAYVAKPLLLENFGDEELDLDS